MADKPLSPAARATEAFEACRETRRGSPLHLSGPAVCLGCTADAIEAAQKAARMGLENVLRAVVLSIRDGRPNRALQELQDALRDKS